MARERGFLSFFPPPSEKLSTRLAGRPSVVLTGQVHAYNYICENLPFFRKNKDKIRQEKTHFSKVPVRSTAWYMVPADKLSSYPSCID